MYLHAEKQRHNSNFLHQTCVIIFAQAIKIFQVVAYLGKNVCNMPLIVDIYLNILYLSQLPQQLSRHKLWQKTT